MPTPDRGVSGGRRHPARSVSIRRPLNPRPCPPVRSSQLGGPHRVRGNSLTHANQRAGVSLPPGMPQSIPVRSGLSPPQHWQGTHGMVKGVSQCCLPGEAMAAAVHDGPVGFINAFCAQRSAPTSGPSIGSIGNPKGLGTAVVNGPEGDDRGSPSKTAGGVRRTASAATHLDGSA